MNKPLKNCLLASFLLIIISSCSAASIIAGYAVGKSESGEDKSTTSDSGTSISADIREKPVYYEQGTTQRYFDENSPSDVYQKLISDSANHFTFEFKVQDVNRFTKDKDFILANLENQYSRLSIKFNAEIPDKITIRLVDDLNVFQDDLDTILIGAGVTTYSAFSFGTDLIEIYINPVFTIEKFELTHTLAHELIHIFQKQLNDDISSYNPYWSNASWFIEGMAEGFAYPNETALIHKDVYEVIPNTSALEDLVTSNNSEEYMIGYDAVELFFLYLSNTYGEEKMISLVKCTTYFDQCFTQTIGKSPDVTFPDWLQSL